MFKQLFENRKAVSFDLDGTIVDTLPLWLEARNKVLESVDLDFFNAEDFHTAGQTTLASWENFIKQVSNDMEINVTARELTDKTNEEFLNLLGMSDLEPIGGFWPLVSALKEDWNLKIGLVTNTPKDIGEKVLDFIGLKQTLDVKIFGDDVRKQKPAPDMYYKLLEEFKINSKEIVAFEDSPTGAEASVKAGIETAIIWNGDIHPEYYPFETVIFAPDFWTFYNNMNKTYKESWEEVFELIPDEEGENKAAEKPEPGK